MKALSLKSRTWYKIHRWSAVIAGAALLMWLSTAMTMTWRHLFPQPGPDEQPTYSYEQAVVTPAEVIRMVDETVPKPFQVTSMALKRVLDKVAYEVHVDNGLVLLVDVGSGQMIQVTEALAKEIAQAGVTGKLDVQELVRVDSHSVDYPYGEVPVYQVSFDDDRATRLYVSAATGEIVRSDRGSRLRTLFNSLHTFDALRLFTDRRRLITALLVLASLAAVFVALVGYYLALPRRWQILSRRRLS